MGIFSKSKWLLTVLLAAILLCGCGGPAASTPSGPQSPDSGAPGGFDVPGEDTAGEGAGVRNTDGLEGSYYNDFLRLTLILDGSGGCRLSGTEEAKGRYAAEGQTLTLTFDGKTETAVLDADGDIQFEGRKGYFFRDWNKWGITELETGTADYAASAAAEHTSITDNGDGTLRFRDFDNALAFTYPASMELSETELIGGDAVEDGKGGCVAGRNVTALYSTHKGTVDEFLEDYVRNFTFPDFTLLYDGVQSYERLTLLHEGIQGRLAAATLVIRGGGGAEIAVKVILYTSTYPDSTVNYICKTIFAPKETEGGVEALETAVTDMGAVRIVAQ